MNKLFKNRIITVLIFMVTVLSFMISAASTGETETKRKPFTIAVLPDTQNYAQSYPQTFTAQTEWLKVNKDQENIKFVAHVGDVVNSGGNETEWRNADKSMKILDGVIPYGIASGNHDYNGISKRNSTFFNKYFPPSRFSKYSWYQGGFDKSNDNSYQCFKVAGMDFLVVCLEFIPRDEVLKWANNLVAHYLHHRVIVVTHSYLNYDGKRMIKDKYEYITNNKNNGEEIWANFVSKHENIFMVLCGHILRPGAILVSEGVKGNPVYQLLSNYQGLRDGGEGWFRLMKFVPEENKIYVRTYSPTLKKFWEEKYKNHQEDHFFTLEYDMTLTTKKSYDK